MVMKDNVRSKLRKHHLMWNRRSWKNCVGSDERRRCRGGPSCVDKDQTEQNYGDRKDKRGKHTNNGLDALAQTPPKRF
jgi:hypothetical protein